MSRIVIVEDVPWIRESATELLTRGGFEVVSAFDTVASTLTALAAGDLQIDAALVDLHLPDGSGVDVIRALREHCPAAAVVAFTVLDDAPTIVAALRAGARGYLLKSTAPGRLVPLLQEAIDGGAPMSAPVARLVVESLVGSLANTILPDLQGGVAAAVQAPPKVVPPSPPHDPHMAGDRRSVAQLTPREKDVLVLLAKGLSYPEAARVLEVGLGTIQSHVKAIYTKLEVSSKAEAAILASRVGLV